MNIQFKASIVLLFIMIVESSCCVKQKEDSIEKYILEILSNRKIENEENLVLYISENMCSECINKELVNISEDSLILSNLIIIGAFTNKRLFMANVSTIKSVNKIHILLTEDNMKILNNSPVMYCMYRMNEESLSEYFYPRPCSETLTKEYFDRIKEIVDKN